MDKKINAMINNLLPVLNQERDANVSASAMISLLVHKSMDNGKDKQEFIREMSAAWDHYEERQE